MFLTSPRIIRARSRLGFIHTLSDEAYSSATSAMTPQLLEFQDCWSCLDRRQPSSLISLPLFCSAMMTQRSPKGAPNSETQVIDVSFRNPGKSRPASRGLRQSIEIPSIRPTIRHRESDRTRSKVDSSQERTTSVGGSPSQRTPVRDEPIVICRIRGNETRVSRTGLRGICRAFRSTWSS